VGVRRLVVEAHFKLRCFLIARPLLVLLCLGSSAAGGPGVQGESFLSRGVPSSGRDHFCHLP
jgi:hypothetical protein